MKNLIATIDDICKKYGPIVFIFLAFYSATIFFAAIGYFAGTNLKLGLFFFLTIGFVPFVIFLVRSLIVLKRLWFPG